MALSKLDSLYMAVVADHSKHPHHQGQIEDVDQIQLNNPTCGDVIQLSVKFDENDRVEDIAFVNSGCTISTASASMMTDAVMGKTKEEVEELAQVFSEMVQGQSDPRQEELGLVGIEGAVVHSGDLHEQQSLHNLMLLLSHADGDLLD